MVEQPVDEFPPEEEEQPPEDQTATPIASGGQQTPLDPEIRKTGQDVETDAKPTAKTETGEGSAVVEGAPNQGTESR